MARRTKIIATVGPASDDAETVGRMIDAGMDVARIGLAHGSLEENLETYQGLRAVAADKGVHLGVLADLPGPKVRCGAFPDEGAQMAGGAMVQIEPGKGTSTAEIIEVDYDTIVTDVQVGDRLAFGDGTLVAEVEAKDADSLKARIVHGGILMGRPGLHVPSDRLSLTAPTPQDLRLLDAFVEHDVDIVAVSFVRSAHDIRRLGVEPAPRGPLTVAKIETRSAVDNLEAIIESSGAVMVARGDLGTECPIEELPHLQKHIIRECIAGGRPTITATQMLESMLTSPIPTRAEASDVANAVFDGTSALMLSGETAIGHDPVLAVGTMAKLAQRADQEFDYERWGATIGEIRMHADGTEGARITDALTMAAWRTASEVNASAILCLSQTGFTVRSIARFRPTAKVLGFSPSERTVRQLAMSWGARARVVPSSDTSQSMADIALRLARDTGDVRAGDLVVVVGGSSVRTLATDSLRVVRVP